MSSSAYVADVKGNFFGSTICPPSFVVIASIFSELRGGGRISPPRPSQKTHKKPRLNRVKFNESATACIIEWLAHVRWMDILDKYSTHDLFRMLSINCPGLSLKYWTAAVLISRWLVESPHNWCDTVTLLHRLEKSNPPPPPTSTDEIDIKRI